MTENNFYEMFHQLLNVAPKLIEVVSTMPRLELALKNEGTPSSLLLRTTLRTVHRNTIDGYLGSFRGMQDSHKLYLEHVTAQGGESQVEKYTPFFEATISFLEKHHQLHPMQKN